MWDSEMSDEEFMEHARHAVSAADAPPSHVADFAKLAFSFRDVDVVEADPADELAATRSNVAVQAQSVARGDVRVSWEVRDDGTLFGVVSSSVEPDLQLQTADLDIVPVPLSTSATFDLAEPTQPYRFIVKTSHDRWATPWSQGN